MDLREHYESQLPEEQEKKAKADNDIAEINAAVSLQRQEWLSSPHTQAFLKTLNDRANVMGAEAMAAAYNSDKLQTNTLTKAETIRKIVEYAYTGNTNW